MRRRPDKSHRPTRPVRGAATILSVLVRRVRGRRTPTRGAAATNGVLRDDGDGDHDRWVRAGPGRVMLNATPITLVGNLTESPELRFTPAGVAMCRFTVAVNPRVFDKGSEQWRDGEASFYTCTAWRQLAENVVQSLAKGMRVIVTGTIAQQRWETEQGEKRSTFAVTADAVGPDLTFATATVRKAVRAETSPEDLWTTALPADPTRQVRPGLAAGPPQVGRLTPCGTPADPRRGSTR